MYELDKVIHSAVGLGSILTALSGLVFWMLGVGYLVLFMPIVLAIGKEIIDKISYGKFDVDDVKSTLNPLIIIKWYRDMTK